MSVDPNVSDAVDLLVAELGPDGAEAELQRRFQNSDGKEQDRAKEGLAALRRRDQE